MRRALGWLAAVVAAAGLMYAGVLGPDPRTTRDAPFPRPAGFDIPGPSALEEGDPVSSQAVVREPDPPTGARKPTAARRPPRSPVSSTRTLRRGGSQPRPPESLPGRSVPPAAGPGEPAHSMDPVTPPIAPETAPAAVPVPLPPVEAPAAPSPRLTPPVPLDQPPLHPMMRTVVSGGPGGVSGLEELSVRGRLRVRLLVQADGTVGTVEMLVSSGDAALDQAAREGLLRWRFIPASRDGRPIDAYLSVWITFRD